MGEPPLFFTMKFFRERAKPPVQEWLHLREWCGRENHHYFKLKHREKNTRACTPALIFFLSDEIQDHWPILLRNRRNNFMQPPPCRGQCRKLEDIISIKINYRRSKRTTPPIKKLRVNINVHSGH